MRLSEAIEAGVCHDVREFSFPRYGYDGDPEDKAALAAWLRAQTLLDVEWLPDAAPVRTTTERRRSQDAFRRAVGDAYGWRCALSGCDEPGVLEAAHLRGWRSNNAVSDGVLLRADLHNLLDRGLLVIRPDYTVAVRSRWYSEFDGRRLRLPRNRADWPRIGAS